MTSFPIPEKFLVDADLLNNMSDSRRLFSILRSNPTLRLMVAGESLQRLLGQSRIRDSILNDLHNIGNVEIIYRNQLSDQEEIRLGYIIENFDHPDSQPVDNARYECQLQASYAILKGEPLQSPLPIITNRPDIFRRYINDGRNNIRILSLDEFEEMFSNWRHRIINGQVTKSMNNAIEMIKANKGNKMIVGAWTLRNNGVMTEAKLQPSIIDKLIVYSPWDASLKLNPTYLKEANQLWGDNSSPVTAMSYDAALVLITALNQEQNPNRTQLKEILDGNFKVEKGASGTITFDSNGNRNNLPGLLLKIIPDPKTGLKFAPVEGTQGNN